MSAPKRPAMHFDPAAGEAQDARAAGRLIDNLASLATTFPRWIIEDAGIHATIRLLAHDAESSVTVAWSAARGSGTITAVHDGSGWVLVTAETAGAEVFRAYLERPYEEYELWPAHSMAADGAEGSGRVSKRLFWVSLAAAAWPMLAPLANAGGWVNIAIDEAGLRDDGDAARSGG